jgi:SAM-dependent methyltransferase
LSTPRIFDAEHYENLNAPRATVVSTLLSGLIQKLALHTALDVGCGLGYFAGLLQSLGLKVSAVDGRHGNVEEARRRFPEIPFHQFDAEDPKVRELGIFDLVFCFGLLYHLENPMNAVRHLHAMTRELLLIEAVTFPGEEPIMALVDEGTGEDQALNRIAFYPTEACLVKMLYRAGFSNVYRLNGLPKHPDYYAGTNTRRTRTMLAGSIKPIRSDLLELLTESSTPIVPWDPCNGAPKTRGLQGFRRFVRKLLTGDKT